MLVSVLTHSPARGVVVHLLCGSDVDEPSREQLSHLVGSYGAELKILHPPALPDGIRLTRAYPAAAWSRLCLPELLPDLSSVLYLDSDLLAVDAISPLWDEAAFGDNLLRAVTNVYPDAAAVASELGLPSPSAYFNSGVMVLNLEAMRAEQTADVVLDLALSSPGMVRWADQDPLNVVAHARRQPLDLRWNVQAACYEMPIQWLNAPIATIETALRDPAIIHFSGAWKPWHFQCRHPLRNMYAFYRSMTPWADWQIEGRTVARRLLYPLRAFPERSLWPRLWSESTLHRAMDRGTNAMHRRTQKYRP